MEDLDRTPGSLSPPNEAKFRKILIALAVLVIFTLPLVRSAIVLPLSPEEQAKVAVVTLSIALLSSRSRFMRPMIIFMSGLASVRYFYWRIGSTLSLDNPVDGTVSLLLLVAELYGLLILFLGYFQTIEVTSRTSPPLKAYPSVDVFITTYNEPIEIVRRTLIGVLAMEYPNKRVFVLDDGRRSEFAQMTKELGCGYITRSDNRHAKAGNLNNALSRTDGELVAIFDADHVPVRGFLNRTVGFFSDTRVALVQTAQHFFNPDPYERNLNLTGRVAPEQTFFYRVIQRGNDFWNSAFFCGSCAVLRRSALQSVGGLRTDTVTEDAHTAMQLHAQGFLSVYLPVPLAAGLATETFAAHVKQRMRWARGMAQILRIDCPLFKKGLSLPQRLNYFNAMLHFFFGIPRLIMVLAPLSFLLLGVHPIRADVLAVFAYILPHVGLSTIANSIISKEYRHSFWAGVYEVSIAPYTALVTAVAMINPRFGKFNVTEKGAHLDQAVFDYRNSAPTLALIALSVLGLAFAFPVRLYIFAAHPSDPSELDSIMINSVWAFANLITLIAAACVAFERPQQRHAPRLDRDYHCDVVLEDATIMCRSVNLSENGILVRIPAARPIPAACVIGIHDGSGRKLMLQAELVRGNPLVGGGVEAAFRFPFLDNAQHRSIVELLFSPDEGWMSQSYARDNLARSFWYLLSTFWRVCRPRFPLSRQSPQATGDWAAAD